MRFKVGEILVDNSNKMIRIKSVNTTTNFYEVEVVINYVVLSNSSIVLPNSSTWLTQACVERMYRLLSFTANSSQAKFKVGDKIVNKNFPADTMTIIGIDSNGMYHHERVNSQGSIVRNWNSWISIEYDYSLVVPASIIPKAKFNMGDKIVNMKKAIPRTVYEVLKVDVKNNTYTFSDGYDYYIDSIDSHYELLPIATSPPTIATPEDFRICKKCTIRGEFRETLDGYSYFCRHCNVELKEPSRGSFGNVYDVTNKYI